MGNGFCRYDGHVPSSLRDRGLTLLTEDDKNDANAKAIVACEARWHAAEREVITAVSRIGGDINDALMGVRP